MQSKKATSYITGKCNGYIKQEAFGEHWACSYAHCTPGGATQCCSGRLV